MQIRWTDPALHDFTHMSASPNLGSGDARSRRTALQIFEVVESLSTFPNRGRSGRKPGTSELVIYGLPFVAVYRLRQDSVEILRILHGAQRWP
jgi:toxin ParE1/3/4